MQKSRLRTFAQSMPLAAFMVAASACGGAEPPAQPAAEAPAAAPAPAPAPAAPARRVFFVEPQDGATVKSPVKARFGLEGYELAPVPKGTITAEQVRAGMGHHHLGIDMDCLPAGTEIVKGTPSWVHFGTGATEIDVQLTPGDAQADAAARRRPPPHDRRFLPDDHGERRKVSYQNRRTERSRTSPVAGCQNSSRPPVAFANFSSIRQPDRRQAAPFGHGLH